MTRALAAAAVKAALISGCDLEEGAGPVRTQARDVTAFDRIEVAGRTDVTVRRGSHQTLTLRGGERLLEDVTTTVAGGTLAIDREGRHGAGLDDASVTGIGDIAYHGDPNLRSDVSGLGDVHAVP